ncbi:polyketide synthase family protein [Candidatus Magnetomorum sp. HK-1]|nr:polyketide synthase family protein [Candidatus Magnetomorum sp. HK-1]
MGDQKKKNRRNTERSMKIYNTEITRQHFIQAQDFLRAATWAGLFPIEPDEVLMAAAENGIFPKNSLSFKYKPISPFRENEFEKRPYNIRHPNEKDLDALLKVEKDCWPKHLRASPDMISQRISKYPDGNCVFEVDGRIMGVIYSQRINSIEEISKISIENASSIHSDFGSTIQFLSISILPEARHFGPGDQLLEYMLQYSALKSDVDYILAVSLCKNYNQYSYMSMEKYIKKRNSHNELIDEILRFHESHGAKITTLVPGYRPKDIDNLCNGVLVEYDIRSFKDKDRDKSKALESLQNLYDVKPESIKTIIEDCIRSVLPKKDQYNPKKSLMDMGVDSVHIIGLRALIKQRIGFEPDATFFFYYTTPESIIQFFEQTHESASNYPDDIQLDGKIHKSDVDLERTDYKDINEKINVQQTENLVCKEILQTSTNQNEPIAVVGMSCRFPGANNLDEYWSILKNGVSTTSKVPGNRWNIHQYLNNTDEKPLLSSQFGGFLKNVDLFDPAFFNIMPREANQMDPQQRILLEETWKALEHSGINPLSLKGTQTGIFLGIYTHDYENLRKGSIPTKDLDIYYATGNSNSIAAGRLSYFYGIHGPSFSVETACSSSLVAVHQACQSLKNDECHLALAAGVNLILSPEYNIVFSRSGMLAKDGQCKTFDAKADGYVRSEGCGVVVLKKLSKAIEDNDNIIAVLKGSAINQDGASNGITAPNGFAQEQVIKKALENAGIGSEEVSYVEAHGTGTLLGDPVEIEAINTIYGNNRLVNHPLIIGSVKTNIGHTESAAGIAGLIKIILSMKHRYIPKHLHFKTLNPLIRIDNDTIQIPSKGMQWKNINNSLIAGVSSFGFSGTNAHLIIENYQCPKKTKHKEEQSQALFVLSSKTQNLLKEYIKRFTTYLEASENSLNEICYTSAISRSSLKYRIAVTATSKKDLQTTLNHLTSDSFERKKLLNKNNQETNKLTFLFTGQGSQYPGMGNFLYHRQPVFRNSMNRCNEILKKYLDVELVKLIYSNNKEQSLLLNNTAYTQPALFAIEYSLAELLQSWGIRPQIVMGHSVGEYVAACIAGVFNLESGLRLIAERARLMQSLPKNGKMAVVFSHELYVANIIKPYTDKVSIAAINGPENIVISGEKNTIESICNKLAMNDIKTVFLDVSHAFHSPLLDPMLDNFRKIVSDVSFSLPKIDIISNYSGQFETEILTDPEYWVNHARRPVRFFNSIQFLNQQNCNLFIEAGPHPVLTGMGRRCLPKNTGTWLSCLHRGENNPKRLFDSVGTLYTFGFDINWQAVYNKDDYKKIALPTIPFNRQRYWIEPKNSLEQTQSQKIPETVHTNHFHPLLGKRIFSVTADQKDYLFQTEVNYQYPAFLSHHIVYDKILMPAAGFVNIAFAAGNYIFESDKILLKDFIVLRPMVIGKNNQYFIQSIVHKKSNNDISIKIFSLLSGKKEPKWIEHASGNIENLKTISHANHESLNSIQSRFKIETPVQNHYKNFEKIHIHFGSYFKGLEQLWIGDNESLGKIQLPSVTDDQFLFHPVLIDSCIQVAWNLMPFQKAIENQSENSWLPVGIDRFEVFLNPGTSLWTYAKINEINDITKDIIFDFWVFDQTGNIKAKINKLVVKQVNKEVLFRNKQLDINRLLYHIQWIPSTLEREKNKLSSPFHSERKKKWLVFADNTTIGKSLSHLLNQQGHQNIIIKESNQFKKLDLNTYQINPLEKIDYESLLNDCISNQQLKGIIYLWGLNHHLNNNTSHTSHESKICASVSYLIQSLNTLADLPKLWLITRETQYVGNDINSIQLSGSSIWGLGRIIELEHHNFHCTLIDIEQKSMETTDQQSALQIFNEITYPDLENNVAYRKNIRYVARLKKHDNKINKTEFFRLITSEPGTFDNLSLKPVTSLLPKHDEVEIRVFAAGLNYKDVLKSLGMVENHSDSPLLFGLECAGIIESVGANVSNFKIGDKVIALHAPGCFGNFVTVKADLVVLKPEQISFVEAATMPIVFLTAWYALVKLANIKKGDRVLIHSAAGGVGQAAIQIIKRFNACVFATASEGKIDYLKSIGVERIMNSRTLDFADEIKKDPGKVDIVLNSSNGEYIPKSLDLVSNGGTFVEIGKIGIWSHNQVKERKPDISYYSFDLEEVAQERPQFVQSMFKELLDEFANGLLKPIPNKTFPVSDITHAFRYMARSKHIGKIAITFPDNQLQKADISSWSDNSYLITGGFGALGLEVAKWLISKGARNIVLCGRSKPSKDSLRVIHTMKDKGVNLLSVFADISDKDQVKNTINTIKNSLPPLKGIIHAAGINKDSVMTRQTHERFKSVMLSKIEGSWNLHTATTDLSLDFFVCFSSFSSVLGWPGQGNYAAANAYMDTLVKYRNTLGLPATTINWGPWAKIGMAARLGKNLREKFNAKGIKSLYVDTSLPTMEKILNESILQSIVIDIDWQKYLLNTDLPFFENFNVQSEKTEKKAQEKPIKNKLTNALPGEAKKILLSYIRTILAGILGIMKPEQIHLRERLFDAGMDSLMAIELKNQLESDLGHSFRNSLLFDYPTVESLVEYLFHEVLFPKSEETEEEITLDGDIDSLLSEIEQMSESDIENQLITMN